MITVTVGSPGQSIIAAWDDLIRLASANVFMNPVALQAANDLKFAKVHTLLAWDEGASPRRLVGLWALQEKKIAPLWPAVLEALPYNYAFLSSPVIDPDFISDVVPAFLTAVRTSPELPKVISLKSFNAEDPSFEALLHTVAAHRGEQLKVSQSARPFATRDFGVKRSGSTRKKLRQDWNRLSALGLVDIANDKTPIAVEQAFETFLTLEAESWKGAKGTALLCDRADAAFVRRMVSALAGQQSASVALLRLDGRAIAAQVLMYCGTTAYTWKTAYNSEFGKYSPGTLLIDKITEELFSVPGIDAIDSCSSEGSFMAQIWAGRRTMVDLLVDVGPGTSMGFRLEAIRQLGYERLRSLRDRFRASAWVAGPKKMGLAAPH